MTDLVALEDEPYYPARRWKWFADFDNPVTSVTTHKRKDMHWLLVRDEEDRISGESNGEYGSSVMTGFCSSYDAGHKGNPSEDSLDGRFDVFSGKKRKKEDIMCGYDREYEGEDLILTWNGWNTKLSTLKQWGWKAKLHKGFRSWKLPNHQWAHDYLYLRHPTYNNIGRIQLGVPESSSPLVYELEFMSTEHNQRMKKKPVLHYIGQEATADDIPALLNLIVSLQAKQPKRRRRSSVVPLTDFIDAGIA